MGHLAISIHPKGLSCQPCIKYSLQTLTIGQGIRYTIYNNNMSSKYLHPLDAALIDLTLPTSGLPFPPSGWIVIREWGDNGYALQHPNGLRLIVDCSLKDDDKFWLHVSISRAKSIPTHEDMVMVKNQFMGDRYAYSVYPPKSEYVNIHNYCLHLWSLVDKGNGKVLPEFSGEFMGIKTI